MVTRPAKTSQTKGAAPLRRLAALALALVSVAAAVEALQANADIGQRPASAPTSVHLVDVAGEAGISFVGTYGGPDKSYITEMGGSGAAWIDYDGDGDVDLFVVNALPDVTADPATAAAAYREGAAPAFEGAGHRLYRNRGDGRFEVATAAAGIGDIVWGNGVAVADVDNDGFADLYVTTIGANMLYRNNGDGTFSRWESGAEDDGWGTSALFTDWDGDGNLDLYVANYIDFRAADIPPLEEGRCSYRGIAVHCGPEGLAGAADVFYRNRGDGSFERWAGLLVDADATYGFALVATDCDDDAKPDIYVATDSTINLLYRRDEAGGLLDWSLFSGAGYNRDGREQAGMGATAADYDGDGELDLFVTNFQHDYNTLYTGLGGCLFDDDTARLGLATSSLPFMGWGAHFLDIDGDADQDLFVANGHVYPQVDAAGLEPWAQRNLLYLNELSEGGEARFREVGEAAGPGMALLASSRGTAVADYDDDLDVDVLVTNLGAAPTLLQNTGASAAPALRISLIGRAMNRSAYGATVTVVSGGRRQVFELRGSDGYLGSNDPRLLVHLPGGIAEEVHIAWGGGDALVLHDVAPGRLVIDESRGVVAGRHP